MRPRKLQAYVSLKIANVVRVYLEPNWTDSQSVTENSCSVILYLLPSLFKSFRSRSAKRRNNYEATNDRNKFLRSRSCINKLNSFLLTINN
jgi:hypothetical protein